MSDIASTSMSSSQALSSSFSKMVHLIDSEATFLKGISSLRGADADSEAEVQHKLKTLDNLVSTLEERLEDFEGFVDVELVALEGVEEVGVQSELQYADVQALKENIPEFLNVAPVSQSQQRSGSGSVLSEKVKHQGQGQGNGHGNSSQSGSAGVKKGTDKHTVSFQETPKNTAPRRDFTFITTEELAAVAKSTRSRLTLAQVTTALQTLVGLIAEREKLLTKTWKKSKRLSQENKNSYEEYKHLLCAEHGDEMFLTEREIRSSSVFEAGEATGRAVLHTLRALRRLKQVRTGGETTYIALRR